MKPWTLAACLVVGSGVIPTPTYAADDPATGPRYALEAGREITYHTEAVSKKGEGATYLVDWKIWAIDRGPDGAWRLVLRCDLKTTYGQPDPAEKERVDTLIWRCRLFDDGRLVDATTMGTVRDPFRLFPRLPDGAAERAQGWDSPGSEKEAVVLHHRLVPDDDATGKTLTIATKAEGPEDRAYLSSHAMRATFDTRRGIVTRVETEDASEHLTPGEVTRGVIELVAVEDRGAAWAAGLGKEADRYFDAVDAYEAAAGRADREGARCRELLAEARAGLEEARKGATNADFRDALGKRLADHDRSADYLVEQANERAGRIGKAAADWEAPDIDGQTRRLSDDRGKVVVMDFWYRNCGWCIHAMPQVNRLAEAFRGEAVAVLGMCTDEKEADARAVIDAMGLKYPTIKAAGIPEKFGVQGFPTLIVVDPAGTVREIHVGYSPRLYEDLSATIRTLLAEKPDPKRD